MKDLFDFISDLISSDLVDQNVIVQLVIIALGILVLGFIFGRLYCIKISLPIKFNSAADKERQFDDMIKRVELLEKENLGLSQKLEKYKIAEALDEEPVFEDHGLDKFIRQ